MSNFTLGLDMGTNSIGWALVENDEDNHPCSLLACGSRIFQEAVDAKTRTPKNQARRQARQARKLLSRRKRRRGRLLNFLVQHDLLPKDESESKSLFSDDNSRNPYLLRKRGLDERLELHEFGRVLYHINQRRGFKSNRKAQFADLAKDKGILAFIEKEELPTGALKKKKETAKEKEEGEIAAAVSLLKKEIAQTGARTLGEYLCMLPKERKKRKHHAERAMYEEEFEQLWRSQQRFYPDTLTDSLRAEIYEIIFFQRPLKNQKFLVGKCSFEPTRKRATKALLEAQRFRILQDIANLKIKDPITRVERPLLEAERKILIGKLHEQESITWGKVRKLLKLHDGEKINLEEGGKDKLIGNRTVIAMRKALPDVWDKMTEEQQKALLTDLLTIDRKDALIKRLMQHWAFSTEQAYHLAITELEPGYASLSLKAINKILPHLEAGLNYHDAFQQAGYLRDDQKPKVSLDKLLEPINLRNPVVQKALFETRRVINAIIRQYGKPSLIRVELARDMKLTKKQKESVKKQNEENKRVNREAAQQLFELGIIHQPDPKLAKKDDLLKYRLWKECKGICPYSDPEQSIGLNMLFSPDVEIEHIIPYSLSLDDSFMNKTICMTRENRNKNNRIPYAAYSMERYERMLQRLSHMSMPYAKRQKFEMKEVKVDDFISRQLNDTRYISVEVRKYLEQLGVPVEISKGEATAALRKRWDLNTILAADASSEKNRADHRHHALDAVVIALTSRYLFQKLSRLSATSHLSLSERGFNLDLPWPFFNTDVKAKVRNMIVSHAANRKITGALHEDTAYGYSEHEKCFVYRKPLDANLTLSQVNKIRDAGIRELVIERLERHEPRIREAIDGTIPKKSRYKLTDKQVKTLMSMAFGNQAEPLLHKDRKTPIRKVRIIEDFSESGMLAIKDGSGREYKYHALGNNHHVEIIEHIHSKQREGIFVSTAEAARRARIDKVDIAQKQPPWKKDETVFDGDWRYVTALSINDMLEVNNNGKTEYYRLQKMSGPNNSIILRHHAVTASADTDNTGVLRTTSNTLRGKKVTIDSLGRVIGYDDKEDRRNKQSGQVVT